MDTEFQGTRASGQPKKIEWEPKKIVGSCAPDHFHPPRTVLNPSPGSQQAASQPGGPKGSSYLALKAMINSTPLPHAHNNSAGERETGRTNKGKMDALSQQN